MELQLGLLEWRPPAVSPKATDQGVQLARVEGRLAETVLAFCRMRLEYGPAFFAQDLCSYVHRQCGGAPESAMRVLRQLRRSGQVQVELVSRASSSYLLKGVSP